MIARMHSRAGNQPSPVPGIKAAFVLGLAIHCICWISLPGAWSQTSSAPTFERATQYATAFSELNAKIEENYSELASLLKQIPALQRNLQDSAADLQGIQGLAFEAKVRQQSAIAVADANNYEANRVIDSGDRRAIGNGQTLLTTTISVAGQAKAEALNLQQVRNQLTIAQQATVERRLKVLAQLQSISGQAEERMTVQNQLTEETIGHTDFAGKRCRLELRAALHALELADSDNAAAELARGITLLRLGQFDQAESSLNKLVKLPVPISAIAKCALAEVYARTHRDREAKSEIGPTMKVDHPAVALLRSRAWAIMGMNSDSVKSWEQLAKHKSHQHLAWTSLALLHSSINPNRSTAKKILEQALLADDLSNGSDWYYKLAVAFAHAANNDSIQAADTARQAAGLAIGDKRQLCFDIANQFQNGQNVRWDW